MAKYLFVYHRGNPPTSDDEMAKRMDQGGQWFGSMGTALIDGGNPVFGNSTVSGDGSVAKSGGANTASGYSLVETASTEDAHGMARGCPILQHGGTVEVGEAQDM